MFEIRQYNDCVPCYFVHNKKTLEKSLRNYLHIIYCKVFYFSSWENASKLKKNFLCSFVHQCELVWATTFGEHVVKIISWEKLLLAYLFVSQDFLAKKNHIKSFGMFFQIMKNDAARFSVFFGEKQSA